jgi:hypothetical protein
VRPFWDFVTGPLPDLVARFDVDVASYTGNARQSRNYYDALRARGIQVLGIQETTNERAQEGYQAGVYDVEFARRRWREVGFTDADPIAYAVSDGSRFDPTWNGDKIADYGQAVGDHEPGPYKFYGNRYAVDAACAGAARSFHPERCLNLHGGWLPRTWGFDPTRDTAAQEVGATPVGGIDVNTTYRPIFEPAPPPPPPEQPPEVEMSLAVIVVPQPAGDVLEELVDTSSGLIVKSVTEPAGPFGIGNAGAAWTAGGRIPVVSLTQDEYLTPGAFGLPSLHDRLVRMSLVAAGFPVPGG